MPIYFVTGTNCGLGLEWVRQLCIIPSNTIIASARDGSKPHDPLPAIKSIINILECDIGGVHSIVQFGEVVTNTLGGGATIDYLINNAGMATRPQQTTMNPTLEELTKHLTVHVYGPATVVNALLRRLHNDSIFANISSRVGSCEELACKWAPSRNSAFCTPCAITKVALNILTVHESLDVKSKGIIVIALVHNWVKTDMDRPYAIVEVSDSVSGLYKTLHQVKMESTGHFNREDGNRCP
ncbi:NADP-dependent dehydrogenase-like protein [Clavulina sp. PMI_390]|nr:NADP-dependent dehydrogenase-like protein [Clavulina sp. PMI_390]